MRGVVRTVLLVLLVAAASVAVAQQTHKLSANGVEWEIEKIGGDNAYKIRVKREGRKDIQGRVEIPKEIKDRGETYTIVEIGESAFSGCSGLTEVVIPSGVTEIGESAFSGCSGLTEVVIPSGVTRIGWKAFSGCSGLNKVTIPGSVTEMHAQAFDDCSSLTEFKVDGGDTYCTDDGVVLTKDKRTLVCCPQGKAGAYTIPNSVTEIGKMAFYGCSGLTSLTIPGSVTAIGEYAFAYCEGLTSLTIPGSVTTIGNFAFAYCSGLTSMTIPGSVTTIGLNAFDGCSGLTAVAILEGVKEIGPFAFSECSSLKEVTISGNVQQINGNVFSHCGALQSFKVPDGDRYCEVDGVLFTKDKSTLVCYPMGRNGAYTIPDGVADIWFGAFAGCSGLTKVTLPEGVESISHHAFEGCSSLTEVSIPKTVEVICSGAFADCTGLTAVLLPIAEKKMEIWDYAFSGCSSLTEVTIPEGVTEIDEGAFSECSSLTKVTIPKTVNTIESKVFSDCEKLKAVYWLAGDVDEFAQDAFSEIPSTVTLYVRPGEKEDIEREEWAQGFEDIVEGHVVSFQDGGVDLPGEQLLEPNGKATALKPAPTKEGFTFVEWQLEGSKYDFNAPVTKDITLVAKWEALPQFKVTFNADGGTPVPEAQMVTKGGTAKAPAAPTKEGFTFVEWQLEGAKYDFNAPVTKDITLVAKWEKIEAKGPNSHSTAVESALLAGVQAVSNPVGDALVLEGMARAARVEVYSVAGVQVQAEALHGAGRVEIDARGWARGVYVVRVVARDGAKTLRVVK